VGAHDELQGHDPKAEEELATKAEVKAAKAEVKDEPKPAPAPSPSKH
jgi:hypothetical protein